MAMTQTDVVVPVPADVDETNARGEGGGPSGLHQDSGVAIKESWHRSRRNVVVVEDIIVVMYADKKRNFLPPYQRSNTA